MRYTVESSVSADITEYFLPTYRESFAPLATQSAQKQLLSDEEFRVLMDSPTTMKFCGWTEDDELAALAVVAMDLSLVPWLSEPFFAQHYPEEHARQAVGCVMTILVGHQHRDRPWIIGLVQAIGAHTATIKGVAVFDCCKANVEVAKFPELIAAVTPAWVNVETELLDYQNYYGFRANPTEVIDLTAFEQETSIDLTVQPAQR